MAVAESSAPGDLAKPVADDPDVMKLEVPTAEPSRPSAEDDDDQLLFEDQEGAQSLIQPAISPLATHLISPKTPAAEKAAALDQTLPGGGYFDAAGLPRRLQPSARPSALSREVTTEPSTSRELSKFRERPASLDQRTSPSPEGDRLPAPWQAGRKDIVVRDERDNNRAASPKPSSSLSTVFGQGRHRRSSSAGAEALKRLSKAFPSISSLFPDISTPRLFSSMTFHKADSSVALPSSTSAEPPPRPARGSRPPSKSLPISRPSSLVLHPPQRLQGPHAAGSYQLPPDLPLGYVRQEKPPRPPSVASRKSYRLRRSTSDDSLLYHSLSRVSSLGDDEDRFENIRDQVNSRFKAIKDSWPDRPTFKMPQLQNFIPTPSKKGQSSSADHVGQPRPQMPPSDSRREPVSGIDAALASLTGDVVVLGGYRGSILRSAQPPYRQLWVPVKVGLKIRKVNLEVGLDPEDEENMEEKIFPSGMLQNIGPVDISKRLFKKLRECENAQTGKLRVHDFGYDWRLSPHLLSRKLLEFLEKLPSNQPGTPHQERGALVIAHSFGGLITRHAVNQRPELFSGVVYAGVPQRCVNILGPIRNGDAVLLNEKVLTAQVNFSLRTSYAFLPEDGFCFIDKNTKEEYRVDFFDVNDWVKYRWSPCIEPALPPLVNRSSTFGSFLSISDSLSNLPRRGRSLSGASKVISAMSTPRDQSVDPSRDRTIAPQMSSEAAAGSGSPAQAPWRSSDPATAARAAGPPPEQRARNMAYLARTLADTKRFRLETYHRPEHTAANAYPPLAVVYGKDTPTVAAARVASREAIACADAYDDLVFRGGDGVVLTREAMLPEGYEVVRGGRISTGRGHVTILGDLGAVGRAIEAVVRGRAKGIGLGEGAVEKSRSERNGAVD